MKKLTLILLFILLAMPSLDAAHATTLSISSAIPGNFPTAGSTATPGAYIANFYQLALMLGGVLALGAIVYGGVLYAISAGNPSKQTEGKEWIESALIGLLLLAGAYLVLYTINPNLTNLTLPAISVVGANGQSSQPGSSNNPALPSQGDCVPTNPAGTQFICNGPP